MVDGVVISRELVGVSGFIGNGHLLFEVVFGGSFAFSFGCGGGALVVVVGRFWGPEIVLCLCLGDAAGVVEGFAVVLVLVDLWRGRTG